MADTDLNIKIKLIDQMTANLAKVEAGLANMRNTVERVGTSLTHAGSAMSRAGSSMMMLGGSVSAPLILAFNNAAAGSLRLSNTVERIKMSTENLSISVANSVAPVMEKFAQILQNLVNVWESIDKPTRDAIVQTTLISAAFLILAGAVLSVTGKIAKVVGFFLTATTWTNPVILGLGAIVAALSSMVIYWDNIKGVAKNVLDGLELGLLTLNIGFQNLRNGVLSALSAIVGAMASYYELMARAPGPQQGLFLGLREGAATVQAEIAGMVQSSKRDIAELEGKMSTIFQGQGGGAYIELDKIVVKAREMGRTVEDAFKKLNAPANLAPIKKSFDGMTQAARQSATAMSNALGTAFFDIVKGKFSDLQDVAASFGDTIIKILMQVLAKFLLIKTVGAMFPGLIPFFHSGGVVQRAHSGMLANDEVPIIAQAGEGIISRRGMQALGRDNFNAINSGKGAKSGGGGITIHVTQAIQAWDASDVYRNRKALAGAIGAEIASNSEIRNVIRKYR